MFGGNAKMWPQPQLYQKAIGKLEFSVAADYFYRPWTHDYVDILLPAATCFETAGPGGRVWTQYVPEAARQALG